MGTVLCLLAAAVAYSVGDVANPRSRGSWIADEAGVIPEAAEVELNRRIDSLDRDLGVEIAVVTVPEVDTTPKEFATALFNRWGVGKRRADNGLLVLLVRDRRRLEMETGYGLEPILPDGWLGGMQQKKMVPRFKAGDFGGGLVAGVEAVESKLREAPAEAAEGTRREGDPPPAAGGSDAGLLALGGAGAAAAGLGGLWGWVAYRRRRTCPQCRVPMVLVAEVADDEHLDEVQQLEERLGSMDYEVRICPQCQFSRTIPHTKWFSPYGRCKQCRARTLKTTSTTEVAATYDHGGRVRVREDCRHCDYRDEYVRHTARLTRSSGGSFSGGGGGGSFGGGRSGGGGAGSSW